MIGENVKIYPHAYIGDNVKVGDNSTIYAGVKIYEGCIIGNHCTVHANAVIGADGFGFAPQSDGTYQTIPQLGNVVLEDHVSIGANTCIDRATMGSTVIRIGAKIDNLVQIAHNVKIGAHSAIAAAAGIAGGTTIGRHCQIGGAAGITGHISIADYTVIGAASNVSKDITIADIYSSGIPGFRYKEWAKIMVYMRNWSATQDKIKQMEKELNELKACLTDKI